ncbi:MAG TPA: hydroxyacylglutathione hydrolase [Cellvibrio sp.]|nr:hydroxyacylglutathione hydrolase [Cellvibrio sp.]
MLSITPIPALDSNYFWVIQPATGKPSAYVVDPGDAAPVIDYFTRNQLVLAAILITHRHHDHIRGIAGLLERWSVPVYGPDSDAIPQVTHRLAAGGSLALEGINFEIIGVPGHTWEHIAYFCPATGQTSPLLFCGDALFAGGCGKRYDGTPEIMWDSLQKLAALPEPTLVYCAHEYTHTNLEFALAFDPHNTALTARLDYVKGLRKAGLPTLPTTISLEKRTNPFLRCPQVGIKNIIEARVGRSLESPAEVFGALRQLKDQWPNLAD